MCFLIEDYLNKKNRINLSDINYKLQEIVDENGTNLGYEVLIDPINLSKKIANDVYKREIKFPHLSRALVTRLERYISRHMSDFAGKHLFINLERSNLCDKYLLCDLVMLKNALEALNAHLVIEITERSACKDCNSIRKGFEFLRSHKVLLAVDDYDLNTDFREQELLSGFYQFMKIEHSAKDNYYSRAIELSKKTRTKLIIERVESHLERSNIALNQVPFWGLQGFLYNTRAVSL
ncbi:diguanylate phosphodiesterase [Vibrio campbellii]|uniref:EAL domain-containing protein n=1 Tax=Vibrio campbellii TaxID=680 RepID=UPI00097177BB|nr:EAL domain-containing protein [Vibrio campbellii]APX09329.1 diguanylate phosphodiesterase [Vibrio campbellii]ARR08358.1 diguanylate phosphodiesterase [Vibrio campbellii]